MALVMGAVALPEAAAEASSEGPAESAPDISVDVSPSPFSPNDDGRLDATTVRVSLGQAATLTVRITNSQDDVVRTLADEVEAEAGTTEFRWEGYTKKGDDWVVVPHGPYRVEAVAADDQDVSSSAWAGLFVDRRAPGIHWRGIRPEPLLMTGPLTFSFRSADRSAPLSISFSVFNPLRRVRRIAGISRRGGEQRIEWRPRYGTGEWLIPGLYTVRLSVTDAVGNRKVSSSRRFRIHRPVKNRVWRRVDGAGAHVALSFDDCNSGRAWHRILDVLDRFDLRSNFFCLGIRVREHTRAARRTVRAGHTIGSHAWDHAYLPGLSHGSVLARLKADQKAWWDVARATPSPYFRPPYGAYNGTTLAAAGQAGYLRTVNWDVDPRDWTLPGASTIARRVVGAARGGSIVVMHTLDQTAEALPSIIKGLRSKGLRPSRLGKLFEAGGFHSAHEAAPAEWRPAVRAWRARCEMGCG